MLNFKFYSRLPQLKYLFVKFDDYEPNDNFFSILFHFYVQFPKLLPIPNASDVGVGVQLCGVNSEWAYKKPPEPKLNVAGLLDSKIFGADDDLVEKLSVVINSPFSFLSSTP